MTGLVNPPQAGAGIAITGNTVSLKTATATAAGALPASTALQIVVGAQVFFPHVYTSVANTSVFLGGHQTDASDPDGGRFSIVNASGGAQTYAVDWRYVA